MALWVNKDLAKKNFVKYAEQYRTLARIVNYNNKVHIDKMKEVIPNEFITNGHLLFVMGALIL